MSNMFKKIISPEKVIISLVLAISVSIPIFSKNLISYGMALTCLMSLGFIHHRRSIVFEKAKLIKFLRSKEMVAVFIMAIAWLLAGIFALDSEAAIKKWAEICGLIIGGIVIYAAIRNSGFSMELFFKITTIALSICSFILVTQSWVGELGSLGMVRYYGSILVIFIPFVWFLILRNNLTWPHKLFWIAILFIITSAIFASGGRTAWLTLAALYLVFPFFYCWKTIERPILKMGVITTIMITGVWFGLVSYKQNFGEYEYELRTDAMVSLDRPTAGRGDIWKNTIPYIEDNLLLGIGIKGVQEIDITNGNVIAAHAHNAVLEILLETGALGLFAFLGVIGVFVYSFLKAYIHNRDPEIKRQTIVIFLACISYGIASMAVTSMFHTWWFLYLVVLLILLKIAEGQLRQQ